MNQDEWAAKEYEKWRKEMRGHMLGIVVGILVWCAVFAYAYWKWF
jgi:hypothetical protein